MAQESDLTVLATDLQFPEGPVVMPDGDVLVVEIRRGTLARVSRPAAVPPRSSPTSAVGPTAPRSGPTVPCYVVNNGGFKWSELGGMTVPFDMSDMSNQPADFAGGWVNRVDLDTGEHTVLYREGRRPPLRRPERHRVRRRRAASGSPTSARPAPRDADRGSLFYATVDGTHIVRGGTRPQRPERRRASPPTGDRVYVAESFTGRLLAWDVDAPGSRSLAGSDGRRGDEGPLRLARRRGGRRRRRRRDRPRRCASSQPTARATSTSRCLTASSPTSPSAASDMRTAYLTFSGGGRLVSLRLATPGLEARLLMATVAELVHARAADGDAPAIRFEDDSWTWAEYVDACRGARRVPDRPT